MKDITLSEIIKDKYKRGSKHNVKLAGSYAGRNHTRIAQESYCVDVVVVVVAVYCLCDEKGKRREMNTKC